MTVPTNTTFVSTTSNPTDNECRLRMFLLQPPLTYIYGTMFLLTALVAAIGNTVAVIVLWLPGQRSKSNRILTSLAISDALVGYILIPINAYQVLDKNALTNCPVDITRAYFTILLIGSSAVTLGIISYDRYLLLTKLNNYNTHMTDKKIAIMLTCAWVIPGITPALRLISKKAYLPVIFFMFVLPLMASCINYCIITKVIYEQEKIIRRNAVENPTLPRSNATNNQVIGSYKSSEKIGSQTLSAIAPSDSGSHYSNKIMETKSNWKTNPTDPNQTRSRKERKRHIKLAKVVAILIACYSFCMIPFIMWMLLDLIDSYKDFLKDEFIQNLYIFSIFTSSGNSCINPCIYIAKNPEFKRGLLKLFRLTNLKKQRSSTFNLSSTDLGKDVNHRNINSIDTSL